MRVAKKQNRNSTFIISGNKYPMVSTCATEDKLLDLANQIMSLQNEILEDMGNKNNIDLGKHELLNAVHIQVENLSSSLGYALHNDVEENICNQPGQVRH